MTTLYTLLTETPLFYILSGCLISSLCGYAYGRIHGWSLGWRGCELQHREEIEAMNEKSQYFGASFKSKGHYMERAIRNDGTAEK